MSPTAEELAKDLRDDLLDEVKQEDDLVVFDGYDEAVQGRIDALEADMEGDPLFESHSTLSPLDESTEDEAYLTEEPEVYGIAFPKTMLPLGAMAGSWTADEVHDLEGGTDEVFVRVWLYGPSGQKGN